MGFEMYLQNVVSKTTDASVVFESDLTLVIILQSQRPIRQLRYNCS